MSGSLFKQKLKEDWYLFVLLAGLLLAAAVGFLRSSPALATKDAAAGLPMGVAAVPAPEDAQETQPTPHDPVTLEEDQARAAIADYTQRVKDDPTSEEAPGLRLAMATLTMVKLHDYKDAARQYELLLCDYPNWDQNRTSYIQLIACYEQLNDVKSARALYKTMLEKFPPDSQEYLFAKDQLGIQ